jgi:hypothetical protein
MFQPQRTLTVILTPELVLKPYARKVGTADCMMTEMGIKTFEETVLAIEAIS